jgi:hypothetical protein
VPLDDLVHQPATYLDPSVRDGISMLTRAEPATPSGEPPPPLTQMPPAAQVSQPRDAANIEHGRRDG